MSPQTVRYRLLCHARNSVSNQRAGRAGGEGPGMVIRLVNQKEWELMPDTDPITPKLKDQTQMLMRLSAELTKNVRASILNALDVTHDLRVRAHETLYTHGMMNAVGDLTDKGRFAADWDTEPALASLLRYGHEFGVMEGALSIYALMARSGPMTSKAARNANDHPHGDPHSLLNVWVKVQWLEKRADTLPKYQR